MAASRPPAPPPAGSAGSAGEGPYRSLSAAPADELREQPCPFCGNGCPPLVRVCPHCDVRLENVRCARCFSLQAPGAFACGRCKNPLELEPLLDATDAPCPRCRSPLESAPSEDTRVHECPRCGGLFVRREALAEILAAAELNGPIAVPPQRSAFTEVKYLPCPLCHTTMNRMNFGRLSGVIVDVCKKHGTWFDAGELTRVVAFVASGGLSRTREREKEAARAEKARLAETKRVIANMKTRQDIERERTFNEWATFLSEIFFW